MPAHKRKTIVDDFLKKCMIDRTCFARCSYVSERLSIIVIIFLFRYAPLKLMRTLRMSKDELKILRVCM